MSLTFGCMNARIHGLGAALLAGALSIQPSHSQSEYPAIRTDSAAWMAKNSYLETIRASRDNFEGPNIIVLLADDLGKHDINPYGPEGVDVPHISRLASEGVVFTEAYSTSAVCNPARAALLTGRYPQRFGNELQMMTRYPRGRLEHFIYKSLINTHPLQLADPWYSPSGEEIRKQGLPESEISLFELMHAAGWRTACIGKWHLGYNEPFLPADRKVDEFFGFYEAFSLYAPVHSREIVNYRHDSFQNRHIWRMKRKGPSAIVRNGEKVKDKGYLTFTLAGEACRFIRENEDRPFLLYVSFSAPHTPFQAPVSHYDRFEGVEDRNRRVYMAMIAALDDAVGEIMRQVRESGIEENTLIFFSSDNGGATYTGATDNGPLKGGKFTHFEGGVNVPFIAKWKGTLDPGTHYDQPVSLMDIYATAFSACRIPPPSDRTIDGADLIPYLTGKTKGTPHECLFWRSGFNKTVRSGRWKLLVDPRDNWMFLYDLEADKPEKHDLKEQYPEIVGRMLAGLTGWESACMPPLWPGLMEYEEEIDGLKMRFAF